MRNTLLSLGVVALACSKPSTTLPQDFAGSYTHTTTTQFGPIQQDVVIELTVSTSGMSVRSTDTPMKLQGGLEMPMGGNPMNVSMGTRQNTSDIFTEVSCSGASCRFKTKQRCEGSIDKNPDGSLTVIANGLCTDWSGSWKHAT